MSAYSSLHILAARPAIDHNPTSWPSVSFNDGAEARATITLTGNADERHAFAADLRRAADFIEAWTEADATLPEPATESAEGPAS